MCGIAGFVSHEPTSPPDVRAVSAMLGAIRHRGPDAEGLWTAGPCALGHRRLSIIDLSEEARQPLPSEDGAVAVVVNGEVYNFASLREGLIAKGHTFRSGSDSEVVVHLWEEHGPACVAMLDGMFALALWDARANTLLLARDRAGKKPLFYRRTARGLAFASEVHALVTAFPDEPAEVEWGAVEEYLSLGYVPAPRSAYRDTLKLPPGHYAVLTPGQPPAPTRYWRKPAGPALTGSVDDLADELLALLASAVRRRLVSDVPLGAFLSGGIDSSAVVALMATQSARPVKTFSIGFDESEYSEVRYARAVAERYGTEHHEMVVTANMVDVVPEIARHHGEPFADSSAVATWYLARMTRQHVTVALSGDGGDESFAGYKRYRMALLGHLYDALPRAARGPYQAGLTAVGKAVYPWMGRYASRMHLGEASRYLVLVEQLTADALDAMCTPRVRAGRGSATVERFTEVLSGSGAPSAIGRTADLDWHTYMADDINVKVDIASMAHALEVRCPFLDTQVVEFASRLPGHLLHRARGKVLLRRALRGLLPFSILHRTKRGFGLPLDRWMRRDLKDFLRDLLLDKRARERGLFDPRRVESTLDGLFAGSGDTYAVWALMMLELWFREYIDGPKARAAA